MQRFVFGVLCTAALLALPLLAAAEPKAAADRSHDAGAATTSDGAMMPVPVYDHIVVVVMENQNYSSIIGNTDAPYINALAAAGALLTDYMAVAHPSEPNYLALYAGSTFGIKDDKRHKLSGATLATVLQSAGRSFVGYVEHPNSSSAHNPWGSFPEGKSVEKDFDEFPVSDFTRLPTVAFVIPSLDNSMHDGSVAEGDAWLQAHLASYARWAPANKSLLVVVWDENHKGSPNQVAGIFHGADVLSGPNNDPVNHYNILSTILASYGLAGPANAATAAPIHVFGRTAIGSR